MEAIFKTRRRARRNVRAGLSACALAVAGCFLAAASLSGTAVEAAPVEVGANR